MLYKLNCIHYKIKSKWIWLSSSIWCISKYQKFIHLWYFLLLLLLFYCLLLRYNSNVNPSLSYFPRLIKSINMLLQGLRKSDIVMNLFMWTIKWMNIRDNMFGQFLTFIIKYLVPIELILSERVFALCLFQYFLQSGKNLSFYTLFLLQQIKKYWNLKINGF